MSNSGGSWGPDGYLYLTPHTPPYAYVFELPQIGSVLHHVATVNVPDSKSMKSRSFVFFSKLTYRFVCVLNCYNGTVAGQGIAWDRWAGTPTLIGIYRPDKTVIVSAMPTKEEIDAVGVFQTPPTVHTNVSMFT